jgi:hypothetical protein
MEHNGTSKVPGTTYELVKSLLVCYERQLNIVVHTADCYCLEYPCGQLNIPRFFAAVQRKETHTVLKLHWLLGHTGAALLLPDNLQKLWDGNFSFVFDVPPNHVLPELQSLLERALLQGYRSLA